MWIRGVVVVLALLLWRGGAQAQESSPLPLWQEIFFVNTLACQTLPEAHKFVAVSAGRIPAPTHPVRCARVNGTFALTKLISAEVVGQVKIYTYQAAVPGVYPWYFILPLRLPGVPI